LRAVSTVILLTVNLRCLEHGLFMGASRPV
jgi:hypothetical protein